MIQCDGNEVHVWNIPLDRSAAAISVLRAALSPDERQRAARFVTRELADRWTVARGTLRQILGAYTETEPREIGFSVGPYGKPALSTAADKLAFNLSHSGSVALLAIGKNMQLGIDVELLRNNIDIERLSRDYFASSETEDILRLSDEARTVAFFTCWTRKEAFVKALGLGLSVELNRFRVSVKPNDAARLISVDWDSPDHWCLLDLTESKVVAALAVEGIRPRVRRFTADGGFATQYNRLA